jgi:hypothetical protein
MFEPIAEPMPDDDPLPAVAGSLVLPPQPAATAHASTDANTIVFLIVRSFG